MEWTLNPLLLFQGLLSFLVLFCLCNERQTDGKVNSKSFYQFVLYAATARAGQGLEFNPDRFMWMQESNNWNHHCSLPGSVLVGSWSQEPELRRVGKILFPHYFYPIFSLSVQEPNNFNTGCGQFIQTLYHRAPRSMLVEAAFHQSLAGTGLDAITSFLSTLLDHWDQLNNQQLSGKTKPEYHETVYN